MKRLMEDLTPLIKIVDRLLGPDGCQWDRNQTMDSIKGDLLEETCELIDAIENKDEVEIVEELGDLFFVLVFMARLAEKEKAGSLAKALSGISEKLIRRHPHVFNVRKDLTPEEMLEQWDEIKKKEKPDIKHPLDRIPRALPALARAYEILKAVHKHGLKTAGVKAADPEIELGEAIFRLVEKAHAAKIDPEFALSKYLTLYRADY